MVPPRPRVLYADDYVSVTLDPGAGLVRYARSAKAYPTLDDLRAGNAQLAPALDQLPADRLVLLLDVREAPARNDDAFDVGGDVRESPRPSAN